MADLTVATVVATPDVFSAQPKRQPGRQVSEYRVGQDVVAKLRKAIDDKWTLVFEEIQLPEWCNAKEVISQITKRHLDSILQSEFRKPLSQIDPRMSDDQKFKNETYVLSELARLQAKAIEESLRKRSKAEDQSDLPWSYFATFHLYDSTQKLFYEYVSRRCIRYSNVPGGTRPQNLNRNFRKPFESELNILFKLNAMPTTCSQRLAGYLKIWSAKNYAQVFEDMPFLSKNFEQATLSSMFSKFESELHQLRDNLFNITPEMFKMEPQDTSSTYAMIEELMGV